MQTTISKETERITDSLKGEQLIDVRALAQTLQRSRASIYSDVKAKRLPQPIKLSPRCTRWKLSEINAWLDGLGGAQ